MSSLVVTVHSASPRGACTLELPGEVPLRVWLPKLTRALQLPNAGDAGGALGYRLVHQKRWRLLDEDETLLGAGVATGDELSLVSVAPAQAGVREAEGAPERGASASAEAPARLEITPDLGVDAAAPQEPRRSSTPSPRGDLGQRAARVAHPQPGPPRARSRSGIVALWSGPAGGTGRTMLSLALAAHAAERGVDTVLLALSEPALSAYLQLPRVPNALAFFETGNLVAAEQDVSWQGEGVRARMRVVLGPARPGEVRVERGRIGGLVEVARDAHQLVILDLPPQTPGGNPWTQEALARAGDVVLVLVPTAVGVVAAVQALATLRGLSAAVADRSAPSVHLLLNRRAPGGLSCRAFTEGVAQLWGSCPPVVTQVAFLPGLQPLLDRGELSDDEGLSQAVEELAAVVGGAIR